MSVRELATCGICGQRYDLLDPAITKWWGTDEWACTDEPACFDRRAANLVDEVLAEVERGTDADA